VAITNGYASLATVKKAINILDGIDDEMIEFAIETASRDIDEHCGRVFYNGGTATRNFAANDAYITYLDDLQSLTTLETTNEVGGTYTAWTANDYQLEPINGGYNGMGRPYTQIRAVGDKTFNFLNDQALVRVTGVWGWAAVPTPVKYACTLLAIRLFKRPDSPLGVAGFGDMGAIRVSRFDPDVQSLLEPYRQMRNVG
jgi:hypothetical protein